MLPLGLCLRTNVRQGERLLWSSFRRYNTTTSKSSPQSIFHLLFANRILRHFYCMYVSLSLSLSLLFVTLQHWLDVSKSILKQVKGTWNNIFIFITPHTKYSKMNFHIEIFPCIFRCWANCVLVSCEIFSRWSLSLDWQFKNIDLSTAETGLNPRPSILFSRRSGSTWFAHCTRYEIMKFLYIFFLLYICLYLLSRLILLAHTHTRRIQMNILNGNFLFFSPPFKFSL